MKKFLFILSFIIISCVSKKNSFNNTEEQYKIFREEKKLDVTILHTCNKTDTSVFVIKNSQLLKCINYKYVDKNRDFEEIKFYTDLNDTIYFIYRTKDLNNFLKINSGIGRPGNKKNVITTYGNPPYFLKDCNNLID